MFNLPVGLCISVSIFKQNVSPFMKLHIVLFHTISFRLLHTGELPAPEAVKPAVDAALESRKKELDSSLAQLRTCQATESTARAEVWMSIWVVLSWCDRYLHHKAS
jgi:hypothetical protein